MYLFRACIFLLLIFSTDSYARPPLNPAEKKVRKLVDLALDRDAKLDLREQDSLLSRAVNDSRNANLPAYAMRITQLRSFLKQQQSEFDRALELAQEAVSIGRSHKELINTVSFRDAITNLALCFNYTRQYDSSSYWVDRGLELAGSRDDFNRSLLITISAIGEADNPDLERVYNKFDQAILLAANTSSPHDDVMAVFNKAEFIRIFGKRDWAESIQLLLSMQPLIDHPDLESGITKAYERVPFYYRNARTTLYRHLSTVYFMLSDVNNACYYQGLIAQQYIARKNFQYLPFIWSDLAEYETARGNRARVQHIMDSTRLLIRQFHKQEELVYPSFKYAMGWLEEEKENYSKAARYYKEAADLISPYLGLANSSLLRVKVKQRNYQEAAGLVREISKKLPEAETYVVIAFRKELADYHQAIGEPSEARSQLLEHYRLKDSLSTAARYYLVSEFETRFKTRDKEKALEVSELKQELQAEALEHRQKQVWALVIGLLVLTGILLFTVQLYRVKRRQAILLEEKKEQVETLMRELHHRVKNNLQVVSSLMSMQSNRIEDEQARLVLEEGKTRMNAMALVHQKLYLDKDLSRVHIGEYLENLCVSLAQSFGFGREHISSETVMGDPGLSMDQAIPIGLIVNEVVTNSFKHAFGKTANPLVKLKLEQMKSQLVLTISDNGSGYRPGVLRGNDSSFGMKLVNTLATQLNGQVNFRGDNGTLFTLKIKT